MYKRQTHTVLPQITTDGYKFYRLPPNTTKYRNPQAPHDARPPPTWSQHWANMGSKRSAKIGPRALEIWSRGDLKPKSPPDLRMDSKWTPKWTPDGPKCTPKHTPNGPQMIPKSTSNGPSIDSQIDVKGTLRSVPRSNYSRAERPCR